jgi:hypothetical protein
MDGWKDGWMNGRIRSMDGGIPLSTSTVDLLLNRGSKSRRSLDRLVIGGGVGDYNNVLGSAHDVDRRRRW